MKKTQTKKTISRKPKAKKYQSEYLAVILAATLLLEGALFGAAQPQDWQKAARILDMSAAVSETANDTIITFQPVVEVVADVNLFYQMATEQMMTLLDLSKSAEHAALVVIGVSAFYDQASNEMAKLLDVSSMTNWPARVAGVSITAE